MIMKRLFTILFICLLLYCPIQGSAALTPDFTGCTPVTENLSAVEIQGRLGWKTDIDNEKYDVPININDCLLYENTRGLLVNVTYFDEGIGCFALRYSTGARFALSNVSRLSDTKIWKTATFILDGAVCNKSVSGADFLITVSDDSMGTSPENAIIGGVDISPAAFTLKDTGISGNVYTTGETPTFDCSYYTIYPAGGKTDIGVSIKSSSGTILYVKNESISQGERLNMRRQYSAGALEPGAYKLELTCAADGKYYKAERSFFVTAEVDGADDIGINTHIGFQSSHSVEDFELMKRAGFKMIRDVCWWEQVEKTKGVYSIPQNVDDYLTSAHDNGLEPLVVLARGNTLYNMDSVFDLPVTDEQIGAFAKFCYFTASRLKGRVKYYEIWNEPDQDLRYSMEQYAAVLKAAKKAVSEADPEAFVVGISAASILEHGGVYTGYIDTAMNVGAGENMDALSIHAYPYLTGSAQDGTSSAVIDECFSSYSDIVDGAEKSIGGRNLELWLTETGYASSIGAAKPLSEEHQGAYIVRTLVLYKADGRAEKVFIYDMKDETSDETVYSQRYGLLRKNSEAKPSYGMAAAMLNMLQNAEYDCCIVNKEPVYPYRGYSIYKFLNRSQDREVYVLWANGGDSYQLKITAAATIKADVSQDTLNIMLPANGRKISVYDEYGSIINDGNITLNEMPKYIVCGSSPGQGQSYEKPDISVKDGKYKIVGQSAAPGSQVTLRIHYPASAAYDTVDQCRASENGKYSFEGTLNDGVCIVHVNDGGLSIESFDIRKTSVTLMANGEEIKHLSEAKPGDKITAVLKAENFEKFADSAFFAALYNGQKLMWLKCAEVGSEYTSLEWTYDGENADSLCFFLFDSQLKPCMDKVIVK